eukprot:325551-Rhodomonas_salina.3
MHVSAAAVNRRAATINAGTAPANGSTAQHSTAQHSTAQQQTQTSDPRRQSHTQTAGPGLSMVQSLSCAEVRAPSFSCGSATTEQISTRVAPGSSAEGRRRGA